MTSHPNPDPSAPEHVDITPSAPEQPEPTRLHCDVCLLTVWPVRSADDFGVAWGSPFGVTCHGAILHRVDGQYRPTGGAS